MPGTVGDASDTTQGGAVKSEPSTASTGMGFTQSKRRTVVAKASAGRKSVAVHMENVINLPDFVKWAERYHSHLVCLWRKLDRDGSMSLAKREFVTGLKDLKFPGNPEVLWALFDRDGTGTISFLEFAPEQGLDLARWKMWAVSKFGSVQGLFRFMDQDKSGTVSIREFKQACIAAGLPSQLKDSIETLFQMVDDPNDKSGRGGLTENELAFLDVWNLHRTCGRSLTMQLPKR